MTTMQNDMLQKPMATMNAMRENVMKAGKDVWLAGLGVMAVVENQGMKIFSDLVEKGKVYQAKEPAGMIGKAMNQATDQVKAITGRVQAGVTETGRMVLHRVGLPSQEEIHALIARVEQLTAKVEALGKKETK